LVIGYGRVGKILADRLKAIGCDVTISARKPADLALAEALGFSYINTGQLNFKPLEYDIIFNTVDVKVIEDTSLKTCTADLIIDLSSKGGLSLNVANSLGIKALKAPGLPGIIAPKTAAEILTNTITHIINSYN
jgi:dipicolinate synthase subunit A